MRHSWKRVGPVAGDTLLNIENVFGSTLADTITGDAGVNGLWDLDAEDVLAGGGGADDLNGGAGAARFVYAAVTDGTAAAGCRRRKRRASLPPFVIGPSDPVLFLDDRLAGRPGCARVSNFCMTPFSGGLRAKS